MENYNWTSVCCTCFYITGLRRDPWADPENFVNVFFLVGKEDQNTKYHLKRAIIGPPVKHHLKAFRWLMMTQH